jgi:hypothetical protein
MPLVGIRLGEEEHQKLKSLAEAFGEKRFA